MIAVLPLLLSIPHAGHDTPPEVRDIARLSQADVDADGDVGADRCYLPLRDAVRASVTTSIARAFVDMNRAADDVWKDGVVKTHTCWDVPVYRRPLRPDEIEKLIARYHRPYHAMLESGARGGVALAVDCHTMAAEAPPVAPDVGHERPAVCLGDADGAACPPEWTEALARAFATSFDGFDVRVNDPFHGGFITRSRPGEVPWIQVELSRADFLSWEEKSGRVLDALRHFCAEVFETRD